MPNKIKRGKDIIFTDQICHNGNQDRTIKGFTLNNIIYPRMHNCQLTNMPTTQKDKAKHSLQQLKFTI